MQIHVTATVIVTVQPVKAVTGTVTVQAIETVNSRPILTVMNNAGTVTRATAAAGTGAVAMGCGGVAGSPAALFPVFTKDWCPFPFPFFCDLSPCASRMCTDRTDFVVKLAKQWEHLKPSAPS